MALFQKGKKGGPGRPKGGRLGAHFAKEWADKHGFQFIADVASGKIEDVNMFSKPCKANLRLRCDMAQYLIDRAYGKPTQAHEVAGKDGGNINFTLSMGDKVPS